MKYIISYQKPHNHYIDIEFIEIYSVPNKEPEKSNLYLRGYFNTPLKRRTN